MSRSDRARVLDVYACLCGFQADVELGTHLVADLPAIDRAARLDCEYCGKVRGMRAFKQLALRTSATEKTPCP